MKHTREAMLTLYGDYVLPRGGEIGIGSLIALLGNFGLSELAIRSAVSRMCRFGLLKVKHSSRKSYYSLTSEGNRLLTEGAQRIFRHKESKWDGNWSIVTYSIPERMRQTRGRLRLELSWIGYGALSEATWISPHDLTKEVRALLQRLNIEEYVCAFSARHQVCPDQGRIISHSWNLDKIHGKYTDFLREFRPKLEEHLKRIQSGEIIETKECFVARFNLINKYRKLPFYDPDLPLELLPKNWLRPEANILFDKYHNLLTEKAEGYFDSVAREYEEQGESKKKGSKISTEDLARLRIPLPVSS